MKILEKLDAYSKSSISIFHNRKRSLEKKRIATEAIKALNSATSAEDKNILKGNILALYNRACDLQINKQLFKPRDRRINNNTPQIPGGRLGALMVELRSEYDNDFKDDFLAIEFVYLYKTLLEPLLRYNTYEEFKKAHDLAVSRNYIDAFLTNTNDTEMTPLTSGLTDTPALMTNPSQICHYPL